MSDKLVIIPTYNEKDNIGYLIEKIFSLPIPFDVLIVDDNSPDKTAEIVKSLQENYSSLFLKEREGKLGLGTAYIEGFKWALGKKYQYIFEMDADFSHSPDDLVQLNQYLINKKADLAVGSRYVSGVNVVNWPLGRVVMSYAASLYVRLITGLRIKDTTAGFKCYKRIVLETIDLDRVKSKGYLFQIEMKFLTWKHGFRIVEVPIVFTNRVLGTSKMSGGIFNEAFWGVIKLKCRSLFRHYKTYSETSG